jgi:hypothetical protein
VSDEDEEMDDGRLLEDDDIWETLTGEAGGDAIAAALPEGIDLSDDQWEEQANAERAEAVQQRGADADAGESADARVWAAIEATAAPRRVSISTQRLKHATARQVLASSQYNQSDRAKADAFYKRWLREAKEHREKVKAILAMRKDREDLLAKKKADRLAARKARQQAEEERLASQRDARGFDQLLRQGAVKEKAEARIARGQSATFIVPSEEVIDRKAGILPTIRISQFCPTIKVSAKVMKKVEGMMSKQKKAPAAGTKARVEDPCPYFRVFNKRERKRE